mgnify:CR=1 FL=1
MINKKIKVERVPTGPWKENCYLVYDEHQDTLLIDPGSEPLIIDEIIQAKNLKILAILNTHGHFDHIGAVDFFQKKYNAKFYLHSSDSKLLKSANLYMKIFQGDEPIKIPEVDEFIVNFDRVYQFKNFQVSFIETPGHTEGSLCIKIGNNLFSGDTLLKNAIGRTDLPGGNKELLIRSLSKLVKLPKDLILYPGHGKSTTIAEEKKNIMIHIEKE